MNDNVKKVFEMLGVEPNQEFIIKKEDDPENVESLKMKLDENLRKSTFFEEEGGWSGPFENDLSFFFNEGIKIVPLPKKKKLRDLTFEEWKKFREYKCPARGNCANCPFEFVYCGHIDSFLQAWVNYKDMFSDKFLDQEIEVE